MTDVDAPVAESPSVTFDLHPAWWSLGDGSVDPTLVADALIEDAAVEDPAAQQGLRHGLALVGRLANGLIPGGRWSWALVQSPASGRVDALLTSRFTIATDDLYPAYLDAVAARESTDANELIHAEVREVVLPAGRAIVSHDFTRRRDGAGVLSPVFERCNVAVFIAGSSALLEFMIVAQDLALFDDMVAYAIDLASGHPSGVPGLLQYDGETP